MRGCKLTWAVLLSALLLAGCREELLTSLGENDANEVVLTLLQRGVDARKISAGKSGFAVTVEEEDLLRALEILKENSLPRGEFATLGSVFSGQGMISSQTEEKSRLAYAISQELADTISRIDGVLDARVHVVLSQHDQATGRTVDASAAVMIRHNARSPVVNMVSGIRETVTRAVPGLTFDRVSVVLENVVPSVLSPKLEVKEWYESKGAIYGFAAALALLGAGAAALFVTRRRRGTLSSSSDEKE